jgi:hypothetical protein
MLCADVLATLSREVLDTFTGAGDAGLGSGGFKDPVCGTHRKFDSSDPIDTELDVM